MRLMRLGKVELAAGVALIVLTQAATGALAAPAPVPPEPRVAAPDPVPMDYPPLVRARAGAPNILVVLTDDVGFGAASAFGGPVPTPNLERLAASGLKYNRFHSTAMCSPTRAALLTGRNHHAVGMGALTDFAMGAPGYDGMIPRSAVTVAEVLRRNGYNTAMFGKHHDVPKGPFEGAGPYDWMPNRLGFDYFFGFVGSDTDQWHPSLYRNGVRVRDTGPQPILDQRLADDAIHWLHQQQGSGQGKPFFLYYATGSAHTPHQAPADWIAKFHGKFADGWEKTRERTLARQKAMGLVPADTVLPAWPASVPHWNELGPQEKAFQERGMEAFAAQLAFQDAQFGRILDELERMGLRDNTLILFVEGDNGPDSAGSPQGALSEGGEHGNKRLSPEEHWAMTDKLGSASVESNYGTGWAQAMATPFPFYKQIASHLGGTRNGMVLSWPSHIPQRGLRGQYSHVIDVAPTLMAAAGVAAPETVDGVKQQPVDGIDLSYSFADAKAPSRRRVQYYEMLGNRAIYADGWLASTTPVRRPWEMSRGPDAGVNKAPGYAWELYDLDHDFNQTRDLAKRNPQKLEQMKALFEDQARRFKLEPLSDRTDFARIMSANRAYIQPRDHYEYWGKDISIVQDDAPQITGRSFTITADLVGGEGVIVADGSWLGGWSFAIENGHPVVHHALSVMPADLFTLVAPQAIASDKPSRITFDLDYDGGGFGKGGVVSIAIDGARVAERRIERTIMIADPHADPFDIGLDSGVPVVPERGASNAFTGVLNKVAVDLGPLGQKRAPGGGSDVRKNR